MTSHMETSATQQNSKGLPTGNAGVGFTPGPWGLWSEEGRTAGGHYFLHSICRNDRGPAGNGELCVTDDDNHACIAEARGKTAEEAKANARLIAAAPALYEALEKVCGYLLNAQIDIETGAKRSTAVSTIQGGLSMARAALKQARGE